MLIPCRGNVGMWTLPPHIAQSVLGKVHSLQNVNLVEANGTAVRIETPDDAYPLFVRRSRSRPMQSSSPIIIPTAIRRRARRTSNSFPS